tara:strand:+ start:235 stop:684 length:450 start_codon:yes stop_codon:yes gene_type:complete
MEQKIYENGIKFQCQGSSNCCISRGSYGFVFLSKEDLLKLANFFKVSLFDFVKKYCHTTDRFVHLKETRKNGECIFLFNNNKCGVYKHRPTQCRTWPFWSENMNVKMWNKDVVNFCPGIGKGKLINKKKIEKFIKIDENNAKKIYKERN